MQWLQNQALLPAFPDGKAAKEKRDSITERRIVRLHMQGRLKMCAASWQGMESVLLRGGTC